MTAVAQQERMKLSWHEISFKKTPWHRTNGGHAFLLEYAETDHGRLGSTYQVFPNVFAPDFSASRSNCAALNYRNG